LAEIPRARDERTALITSARQAANEAGYQSPTMVLLVDSPAVNSEDAKWFAGQGVIVLEDTGENQETLKTLREEINSAESDPQEPARLVPREAERWVLDEQGQLVLADSTDSSPTTEPPPTTGTDPEHLYQTVLEGLNAQSHQRR
jgi:hypothetical protein